MVQNVMIIGLLTWIVTISGRLKRTERLQCTNFSVSQSQHIVGADSVHFYTQF